MCGKSTEDGNGLTLPYFKDENDVNQTLSNLSPRGNSDFRTLLDETGDIYSRVLSNINTGVLPVKIPSESSHKEYRYGE